MQLARLAPRGRNVYGNARISTLVLSVSRPYIVVNTSEPQSLNPPEIRSNNMHITTFHGGKRTLVVRNVKN